MNTKWRASGAAFANAEFDPANAPASRRPNFAHCPPKNLLNLE
jgi:hypothetical protein